MTRLLNPPHPKLIHAFARAVIPPGMPLLPYPRGRSDFVGLIGGCREGAAHRQLSERVERRATLTSVGGFGDWNVCVYTHNVVSLLVLAILRFVRHQIKVFFAVCPPDAPRTLTPDRPDSSYIWTPSMTQTYTTSPFRDVVYVWVWVSGQGEVSP